MSSSHDRLCHWQGGTPGHGTHTPKAQRVCPRDRGTTRIPHQEVDVVQHLVMSVLAVLCRVRTGLAENPRDHYAVLA